MPRNINVQGGLGSCVYVEGLYTQKQIFYPHHHIYTAHGFSSWKYLLLTRICVIHLYVDHLEMNPSYGSDKEVRKEACK